ncbi:hypothetical protein GSI_07256 [Ganoderma sinense ZZ0214-1]|uniref:Uncharacterized protein n=1 Tax=Ganoderma sinense ZZ0214-1 TaxID=1077348 RepID=A0A2G8S9W0_9APHY|nr:hypothetical protein GSI_07256 [Ganoderma sinense ZZ0214-1]
MTSLSSASTNCAASFATTSFFSSSSAVIVRIPSAPSSATNPTWSNRLKVLPMRGSDPCGSQPLSLNVSTARTAALLMSRWSSSSFDSWTSIHRARRSSASVSAATSSSFPWPFWSSPPSSRKSSPLSMSRRTPSNEELSSQVVRGSSRRRSEMVCVSVSRSCWNEDTALSMEPEGMLFAKEPPPTDSAESA